MAACIRGHWRIENSLHWQLDVSFGEDQRQFVKTTAPRTPAAQAG